MGWTGYKGKATPISTSTGSAVEKEAGAFIMIPTGSGLQGRKERETSVSGLFDTAVFPKQAFLPFSDLPCPHLTVFTYLSLSAFEAFFGEKMD